MNVPAFLPPILTNLTGEEDKDLPTLFPLYRAKFSPCNLTFDSMPVRPLSLNCPWPNYGYMFHHIVTRGSNFDKKIRTYCTDRASRIQWCASFIENACRPDFKVWKEVMKKSQEVRAFIWSEDLSYVVILQDKRHDATPKEYYSLVSAYVVDEVQKRKFREQYKQRMPGWKLNCGE